MQRQARQPQRQQQQQHARVRGGGGALLFRPPSSLLRLAPGCCAQRAPGTAAPAPSRRAAAVESSSSTSSSNQQQQQQRWRRRRRPDGDGVVAAGARRSGGGGGTGGAGGPAAMAVAAAAAAAAASGPGGAAAASASAAAAAAAPAGAEAVSAAATTAASNGAAPRAPPSDAAAAASAASLAAAAAAAASVDEALVKTRYVAETLLPTRHGAFRLRGYKHTVDGGRTFTEPAAVICGEVEGRADVPVRVHDACFTSEVLGSLKCDCAEQLRLALDAIHAEPPGMVIYLQQEGRGIGLANKIAAYALQERHGLDTVDANRALGLPDDCREYTSVRNILRDLRVRSVRLMTNNPRKMAVLKALGVEVTGRVPCVVRAGPLNRGYLDAKQRRMAHLLTTTHDEDAGLDGEEGEGGAGLEGAPVAQAISGDGGGLMDEATAWAEAAAAQAAAAGGKGGGGRAGEGGAAAPAAAEGAWCYWGHEGEPSRPTSSETALGGFASPSVPGARTVDEEVGGAA